MFRHACSILGWVFVSLLVHPLAITAAPPQSTSEPTSRPNVLFLFTDDQRADTIAELSNPHIETPNLDTLARSGFTFRNAYCFGGNSPAVCLPSRNMLLSGRTYFRFERMASADEPNFPASMNAEGYDTYHHGKLGNTAREIHTVFDVSKYVDDEADRTSGEPGQPIIDEAIEYLQSRDDSRPFFLYLAFSGPHDPRVAAPRYMEQYDRNGIPLPPNFMPYHPFDNGELKIRDEQLAPWPRTEEEIRKHLHDYYAVITAMDGHIGRLLQTLRELEQFDNTIILFSSDHGLALGGHGLMGKQSLYEHSMKVPLFISGPGIPQGSSDAFAYLHDLFPTVCDLIGAPIPEGLDGKSLAPLIRGEEDQVRDSVFTAYRDVQRAMRHRDWKLIQYPQINKTQLFHLADDPFELQDLADDPDHAALLTSLLALLREHQKTYGDFLPLTTDDPKPAEVDLSFFKE